MASFQTVMQACPSHTLSFRHPRRCILSYLSPTDLRSLRLVNRQFKIWLSGTTCAVMFCEIFAEIPNNNNSTHRLDFDALERISLYIERLIIKIPNSLPTTLHEPTIQADFSQLLAPLCALRRLDIHCPTTVPASGSHRRNADSILRALKSCLELNHLAPSGRIENLVVHGNLGLCQLQPLTSFSGRGMHTGWWTSILKLNLTLTAVVLEVWQRHLLYRNMVAFLDAVALNLCSLTISFEGADHHRDMRCPLEDSHLVFRALTELKVWNVRLNGKKFHLFWGKRARALRTLVVRDIAFDEGREAWDILLDSWRVESAIGRTIFKLVRKDSSSNSIAR